MMKLPKIRDGWDSVQWDSSKGGIVLLVGEGFEKRSLSYLEASKGKVKFSSVFIFKNCPSRASRFDQLSKLAKDSCEEGISIIDYDRTNPSACERSIREIIPNLVSANTIVIDISVFSRLLIVMIMRQIRDIDKRVIVAYTEPMSYSPTKKEFDDWKEAKQAELGAFTSAGLHDVMRTPALSSTVMLGAPVVLVAFASFNAHLLSGLLSSLSPTRLMLIGADPPRFPWRRIAVSEIHHQLTNEFIDGNPLDEFGALINETSTLEYSETVYFLAQIYMEYCFTHRTIIAPTGSKMQALGVGIFKAICDDIHIEYPMPQRYKEKDYSSEDVYKIHFIEFDSYSRCLKEISEELALEGVWS